MHRRTEREVVGDRDRADPRIRFDVVVESRMRVVVSGAGVAADEFISSCCASARRTFRYSPPLRSRLIIEADRGCWINVLTVGECFSRSCN